MDSFDLSSSELVPASRDLQPPKTYVYSYIVVYVTVLGSLGNQLQSNGLGDFWQLDYSLGVIVVQVVMF